MKAPDDCQNMTDIREAIDTIDQAVIRLIGQRYDYVKAAAQFKTSETAVRAPDRQKKMLTQRRLWAEANDLNPDVIEKMYQDLVTYFITEEMAKWQTENDF